MKITKEQYLEIQNRLQELETQINGGKGSGNFGHAGRPGEVGGSAPEGGATGLARAKEIAKDGKQWQKLLGDIAERAEQIKSDTGGRGTLEGILAYEKIPKKIIDTLDLTDNPTSSQAQAIAEVLAKEGVTGKPKKAKADWDISPAMVTSFQERTDHLIDTDYSAHSRADEFREVQAAISNLKTNLKSAREAVARLDKANEDDKWTDRARTMTRIGEISKALQTIKQLKKIEHPSPDTKRLIADMEKYLKEGQKAMTECWEKLYEAQSKNSLHDRLENTIKTLDLILNGGKGSGNFGHAGRPGEIGGSAKESGGFGSAENKKRGEARYKNQKVAHREMSYVMRAAHNGGQVSLESVADEPSIKEAFERAKFDKTTLEEHKGDKKREKLQQELENRLLSKENGAFSGKDKDGEHFDGEVANDKEAFIVIGRPAGGKSSVFANPLSQNYKARIIDADLVKTWLPEFDDGFGAGRTQDESAMIMERALKKATDKGENVVIPKIGGESVAKMAKELKDKGYKVHLKYNEVSEASSITRAISRFVEKGRWLDPKYLQSIGDKAERFYKKYAKDKDYFDDAEWLNNDVKFGQKPKKVDKVN